MSFCSIDGCGVICCGLFRLEKVINVWQSCHCMSVYGKVRDEDLPVVKSAIGIFKKHNLKAGLHGTSLWNQNYKDIDVLVVSDKNQVSDFYAAFVELEKLGKVLGQRGNEIVGLDYD